MHLGCKNYSLDIDKSWSYLGLFHLLCFVSGLLFVFFVLVWLFYFLFGYYFLQLIIINNILYNNSNS